jgi:hypothetical protein
MQKRRIIPWTTGKLGKLSLRGILDDPRLQFAPYEHWGNHEWDTMTAMPVVSAAHNVKAAKPGILTLMEIGLPVALAGRWNANVEAKND